MLAAYRTAAECISDLVASACEIAADPEDGPPWQQRLRAAVDAALEFLAAEPAFAKLLGAEVPAAVASVAAARERFIEQLVILLRSSRPRGAESPEGPPAVERRLIEGAFVLISDRLSDPQPLPQLAPELTELLVGPYMS